MSMRFWPGLIFIGPNLYFSTCAPAGGPGSRTGIFMLVAERLNADVCASAFCSAAMRLRFATAAFGRATKTQSARANASALAGNDDNMGTDLSSGWDPRGRSPLRAARAHGSALLTGRSTGTVASGLALRRL